MAKNKPLKDYILEVSAIYNLYASLIGRNRAERIFADDYIKPSSTDKILDLGCGTGAMLKHINCGYYEGFDINPAYIETARKTFGDKGSFIASSLEDYKIKENHFDKAVSCGVLHHLDDRLAKMLLSIAYKSLKPGGSLYTFDGCYTENQNPIDKFLQKNDRGKFVRTSEGYINLAKGIFSKAEPFIIKGLIRIPYTTIIIKFSKN